MTAFQATGNGKLSKKPLLFLWTFVVFLAVFSVGELLLQKRLAHHTNAIISCMQYERDQSSVFLSKIGGNSSNGMPILAKSPTVFETFTNEHVVHWDNLTMLAPKNLHTYIEPVNGEAAFMQYGVANMRNVCIRPNGTMVVVGTSAEEIVRSVLATGETMAREWRDTYNCTSWSCHGGVHIEDTTPKDAFWIPGNTTHIIPYLGNVFHHFSERVWPHLTGFQTADGTPHATIYYVHRMHTWLEQAHHNLDRSTLMFQIAMLARLGGGHPKKFLQHTEHEERPVCFERLTLTCATCGRMSPALGFEVFTAAIERYRKVAFEYFKIAAPKLSTPPHPLRVTIYGRSDASRRRVSNIADVARHLRSWRDPPLLVTFIDEMVETGVYNNTLPEVVSLMAQTDVLITPHGANTWATLFMPRRAAVIEIYGPCGPSTWISNTIVPALQLKHVTEANPWGERIASPRAGNTTDCKDALITPDFTLDIAKLDDALKSLGMPAGPGDKLPLHWLYDWSANSY